jgi:hypothetical protein
VLAPTIAHRHTAHEPTGVEIESGDARQRIGGHVGDTTARGGRPGSLTADIRLAQAKRQQEGPERGVSGFMKSRDRWGQRRLAAAGRSAPDDDQVGASKGDPLPFGQVAPAKDVLPVGVDGDLDRLG